MECSRCLSWKGICLGWSAVCLPSVRSKYWLQQGQPVRLRVVAVVEPYYITLSIVSCFWPCRDVAKGMSTISQQPSIETPPSPGRLISLSTSCPLRPGLPSAGLSCGRQLESPSGTTWCTSTTDRARGKAWCISVWLFISNEMCSESDGCPSIPLTYGQAEAVARCFWLICAVARRAPFGGEIRTCTWCASFRRFPSSPHSIGLGDWLPYCMNVLQAARLHQGTPLSAVTLLRAI